METTEPNLGKMEAQLKHWGANLDDLITKANQEGTDAQLDYHKNIDNIKEKFHAAQIKLDEIKTSGSEKWLTLKTGAEKAWSDLESAFKSIAD